ncbi:DoxX family protein [Mucilaginibacter terrae]|uniref:Membrane protein YphA (DoxX/SURF4 family) n=1 Tax=Mucilaginibacter terrae TaxID=1955052 RepID=A0ABU3GWL4_9SPHI|nr:DoxX family protein [Mucilaginibacter terrae]MDT3403387.1 putative membrane protein YphA (DoxX/SURF4 family) [Mucilaginibacter terrae]
MKITYWIATGIIALMMIYSAYAYVTQPAMAQAFQHIGFPAYFRIELAVAKLIGAVVLLAPVSARLKEWAYAGFAFTFISAFIAHSASCDQVSIRIMPLVFLIILAVSYFTYHKQRANATPANS